jgi:tetratricopeptide (TPR) repeat protein
MPEASRSAEDGTAGNDLVPGRYRLTRLLGRGGMGEVHLATDLLLGREVAIKLVARDRLQDEDARRRLLKEARLTASIDHPCICPVYDCGATADGRAYIVMQYIEGDTLAAVLRRRGALAPREALAIAAQLADALAAAHRNGLVHRDVKPANVIVTPGGAPKLLDLGIAKLAGVAAPVPDAPTLSAATAPGTIVGTPAYMPPEQIEQRPVDGRSDLFSLGALLYEALTGQRAFGGTTVLDTAVKVLHSEPPAPSTVRTDLTERHDALCERLLAKDPAERFQSAQEVVGAIRLLLDEPHTSTARTAAVERPHRFRSLSRSAMVAGVVLVLAAATLAGIWLWQRSRGLPPVPEEAQRWYERGTEAIREGAYISGRTALEQAVAIAPQYVLAYARLAEADAGLGDERSAQQRLVRVASLVSDESMLPPAERPRLRAVRALVLRDVDAAVAIYRDLVARSPDDAKGWLDFGRAQEDAGLRGDARASYEQAVARDHQYAAAYLRLGGVQALEANRAEALESFARAEQLYRAASDSEGETEVLIRRGSMLDALGDLKAARRDLERALRLATDSRRTYQQVRARAALAGVTASEGRFDEAERVLSTAVQEAIADGLDIVAADALIDLAAVVQADHPKEASAHLDRARQLADRAGARRASARARLQQAAADQAAGDPRAALALVNEVLPFCRTNRYRRYELQALSIASRAHQDLDQLDLAEKMSRDVLAVAGTVKDEAQEALALSNLASVTTALGNYPEALRMRDRVIAVRRRQGNRAALPYDLANRADLLVRLGRADEADATLEELEAGMAAGLQPYLGRARRVAFLRGLAAVTALDCERGQAYFRRAAAAGPSTDSAAVLAPAVAAFCDARQKRKAAASGVRAPDDDRTLAREWEYWFAAAALARGDAAEALGEASKGLRLVGTLPNDELRWRLAAVAAVAARQAHDERTRQQMTGVARAALDRLRSAWNADFASYGRRADLATLRKQADLD